MADETSASGGGAPSAYEVNDSDFEVSDVEGDMTEEERETKRKKKIKKKMNERVEKKALALFNERMKLENEKKNQQEFHTMSHTYETSNFQSSNIFSLSFQWVNLLTLMEWIMHVGVMTCKCICMVLTHTFGPLCVLVCLNSEKVK